MQRGGCVPGVTGRGWAHLLEVVSKAELSLGQADPSRFLPAPIHLLLYLLLWTTLQSSLGKTSLQLQSTHLRGDLRHKECVLGLSGLTNLARSYWLILTQILRTLFILPTHKRKNKCCYVELLVGKSRKIKGNACHIQPFGLAQGNERMESIIVVYKARKKPQPWLLHIVWQVNKKHNKILLWQTENWSVGLGIIPVISYSYAQRCVNS